MDSGMILRKLETLRARPYRIADVLREPRQMVVGGTVLNAMGLQVARACKDRALWLARRARVTERVRSAYDVIERDGVVVIPNFLPEEQFQAVRDDYESSASDPARTTVPFGDNFACSEVFVSDLLDRFPRTNGALRDNDFLLDLAAAVSRRRRTYKPPVSFFTVYKPNGDEPHVDLDYNQFAHADRHYAFIKAFLYLDDVDEANAPFSYAKGSHKLNAARLRFEYEYSVRYTRVRRKGYDRTPNELFANASLRDCADRLMNATRSPCLPIVGKANTLIVANNQGFHKRGEMRSSRPRATVNIDFKYLESPAQWMYPVLRHLYPDP
jgi:hypothetical protein